MAEKLKPCPFCNSEVTARKEITDADDPRRAMYVFAIDHHCGAIETGHLSLFFQNDTPREKCIKTLDSCEKTYIDIWNNRRPDIRRETIKVLGELIHEEAIEWPSVITTETISAAFDAVGRALAKAVPS